MKRNLQDAATGREGPTDDWIVLAVHPLAVVRDAVGRVARGVGPAGVGTLAGDDTDSSE
jgi:hypothetical protein